MDIVASEMLMDWSLPLKASPDELHIPLQQGDPEVLFSLTKSTTKPRPAARPRAPDVPANKPRAPDVPANELESMMEGMFDEKGDLDVDVHSDSMVRKAATELLLEGEGIVGEDLESGLERILEEAEADATHFARLQERREQERVSHVVSSGLMNDKALEELAKQLAHADPAAQPAMSEMPLQMRLVEVALTCTAAGWGHGHARVFY